MFSLEILFATVFTRGGVRERKAYIYSYISEGYKKREIWKTSNLTRRHV